MNAMARRYLLVINPAAAASRDQSTRLERLVARLQSAGIEVVRRPTQGPLDAIRLAREAVGFDVVVAVGGDGTVSEVASGLMQRRAAAAAPEPALGIAPFGTGNDVAQLAGTAGDEAFLGAVAAGLERRYDVISVRCRGNDGEVWRAALLFAAVGFASELLRLTTPRVKRVFGAKLCYSVGFFRALFSYRAPMIHAKTSDVEVRERMLVAVAANSPHAGGGMMQVGPGARMDDGVMNLSLIRQATRFEAAVQFPRLLRGTHVGHPKVRYFTDRRIEIGAEPEVEVAIDGDLIGRTPATFEVLPGALRILGSAPGLVAAK